MRQWIFDIFGIQIGPLVAGLGLFSVAVALGAQDLFKNLISGLLIIGENRFQPGDRIEVSGQLHGIVEPIEMMGIKVEWSLLDLIDLPKVEPKVMLEVVRVFQEAIHNAVSRAKCTTLVVSGTVDQNGDIKVLIKNYGGTSLDLDKNIGSGIAGMLSRAKRISARITLTPVEGGAELELILPKLVFTASQ